MAGRIHIIGAGLAGLSAAVRLSSQGRVVNVYESASYAGGRCRSFHDANLDRVIDNGNHLLLSGNRAALAFLREIGAADSVTGPSPAVFPFLDLDGGLRWQVKPDRGAIPWSILSAWRRVPGSRLRDYLRGLRLARARATDSVTDCLGADNLLFRRFWKPLAVSVLNTAAEEGAARLLWPVIRETFGRGEAACRPLIARHGLSDSFVTPATAFLKRHGAPVAFNRRLRRLGFDGERLTTLDFGDSQLEVQDGDSVILAVPPLIAAELVPGLETPTDSRAIVNGHFCLAEEAQEISFCGLIGGTAQWLFIRGDIVSVTVSAADDLAAQPTELIAERLWSEVATALDLGDAELGPYRIVKEKRATFAQTPEQVRRRPGARTRWCNLHLAGDWTDTGLPATIEGAIRSGHNVAQSVIFL